MKILRGVVDWRQGEIDERPDVLLLVDAVPEREVMYFTRLANVLYAEEDGFCRAFAALNAYGTKTKPHGAGIGTWQITMRDGSKRWVRKSTDVTSFRLNDLGLGPYIRVRYTCNEGNFRLERGLSGWVRVSKLREAGHLIDVGNGYSWRPGLASAAAITFPRGSQFSLACLAFGNEYSSSGFRSERRSIADRFPDGLLIEDVRDAIRAATYAGQSNVVKDIADRYVRYLGANVVGELLTLLTYEPAVKLPDGTFWARPVDD